LLIADEPTTALDVTIQAQVLDLLRGMQDEFGTAMLLVTHDLGVVADMADDVAVMYAGRVVEQGAVGDVFTSPMHPYTEALMSAEPIALPSAMRTGKRIVLEGEIPSPIDPPSSCRFRTRCPHARELCEQKEPEWRELRDRHWVACHFATPDGPPSALTH
jgi:peptide/nickel transport system ATP-binding protein/oligopeptide transport system ATP-binding protein